MSPSTHSSLHSFSGMVAFSYLPSKWFVKGSIPFIGKLFLKECAGMETVIRTHPRKPFTSSPTRAQKLLLR